MAATPGKVIFRNELMELIQYAPSTPEVYKRPLLIVPPWINKFYVLDLNPEKSFIRWAVAQGLTVFVDLLGQPRRAPRRQGLRGLYARGHLRRARRDRGRRPASATSPRSAIASAARCSRSTLAFMARDRRQRASPARRSSPTQVDFTDAGDLKVFVDAEQLKSIEQKMAETGYLDGAQMANAFNMLRPNDLIWSYWVNNYLKGKEPMAFDLLVWNSDSTRMPAANHNFYLRHCYLQNDLTNGRMTIEGQTLDLKKVTIPVYDLATQGGPHRAGALGLHRREILRRPGALCALGLRPYRGRRQSRRQAEISILDRRPAGGRVRGLGRRGEGDAGLLVARLDRTGSSRRRPRRSAPREPGAGKLKPLGDAPGEYVKVRV